MQSYSTYISGVTRSALDHHPSPACIQPALTSHTRHKRRRALRKAQCLPGTQVVAMWPRCVRMQHIFKWIQARPPPRN